MLKIRLQRVGRKHEPAFRLVLTDSKNSTKSGKFEEILGSYDPRKSTESFNAERINYWLSVGARPTDTVHNLLVTHKIIDAKKKNVLPKKTPPPLKAEEASTEAPAPTSEAVGDQTASVEAEPAPAETPETVEAPVSADEVAEESPESKIEDKAAAE